MKNFVSLILLLFTLNCQSQILFLSDNFHGGVTGDGYNPGQGTSPGNINLNIEPSGNIRKAILFYNIIQSSSISFQHKESTIFLNNQAISISTQNYLSVFKLNSGIGSERNIFVCAKDVTPLISPMINNYTLTSNFPNPVGEVYFAEYYLIVLYENLNLPKTNIDVLINNKDANASVNYLLNSTQKIDTTQQTGLTLHASNMCDTTQDGSFVFINSTLIGLIGGQEDSTGAFCGVLGSFYYQNNSLTGIGNDVANNSMAGTDAIADISPYLANRDSFNLTFNYQSNSSPLSNSFNQFFLTYTTPCDTFSVDVPEDTAVCYGSQLQLFANGGQTYQWSSPKGTSTNPAPGLSCFDCPNPVFTADSSMFYTVRIWNNDSCSVVRPVLIKVNPPPTFKDIAITPATCGASDGKITLEAIANAPGYPLYTLNNGTPQYISMFNNLNPGEYTLSITNGLGCKSKDSVVTVGTTNPTQASFTATPLSGTVPFATVLNNNSLFADQFSWFVNQDSVGSPLNTLWLDTVGIYNIELIAWQYDPDCADTFLLSITAFPKDTFSVDIPNIFTVNGDGQNDYFSVKITGATQVETLIFNRWGTMVHSSNLPIISGNNTFQLWDGKLNDGKKVAPGVYFYIIKINTNEPSDKTFTGTINVVE